MAKTKTMRLPMPIISYNIHTRLCCTVCCGYIINFIRVMWCIYPCSSGLFHWLYAEHKKNSRIRDINRQTLKFSLKFGTRFDSRTIEMLAKIWKQLKNGKHRSHAFQTLRDLMIRRFRQYWNIPRNIFMAWNCFAPHVVPWNGQMFPLLYMGQMCLKFSHYFWKWVWNLTLYNH